MHRMTKYLVIFWLGIFLSNGAISDTRQKDANSKDYNPAEGFHFYDIAKPKAIEEIAEKVVQKLIEKSSSSSKDQESPGSSAWIKKHLPDVRRVAADDPTTENVRALLLMEKMLRDKGLRLARRALMISQADPILDSSYKPTSNISMARDRRYGLSEAKEDLVKKLIKDGVSAWVFVSGDCSTCERWVAMMATLTEKFGLRVLWVIDSGIKFPNTPEFTDKFWEYRASNGEAKDLGIKSDMSLFAYHEKKEQYILVSQGFIPTSSFPTKLILSADFSGWATPEEVEKTVFTVIKDDLSDPDNEGFKGDYSNPLEYSNYIYDQLLKGQ